MGLSGGKQGAAIVGLVVGVTGASGYLGSRLCQMFDCDPDVERIVGIDVRMPSLTVPKLTMIRRDMPAAKRRAARGGHRHSLGVGAAADS